MSITKSFQLRVLRFFYVYWKKKRNLEKGTVISKVFWKRMLVCLSAWLFWECLSLRPRSNDLIFQPWAKWRVPVMSVNLCPFVDLYTTQLEIIIDPFLVMCFTNPWASFWSIPRSIQLSVSPSIRHKVVKTPLCLSPFLRFLNMKEAKLRMI